jgi:uncharacterized protein
MTLVEQVGTAITAAMKARDQATLGALRMLKAALMNKEVERGRALDESESLAVVAALIKQRRESIDQFGKAGRNDLVDKESAEVTVLNGFLPPAMSNDELDGIVDAAISETGATSVKDLGKVMKAVMPRLAGQNVDGKLVNELVRKRLGT